MSNKEAGQLLYDASLQSQLNSPIFEMVNKTRDSSQDAGSTNE